VRQQRSSGCAAATRYHQSHGSGAAALRFLRLAACYRRSADNRVPVFTFVLEGRSPMDVAGALDERGIAVRAGDMAAMPLLERFGASAAIRASAYVYSTQRDIDRLADALHGIAK
jgi:cysteine desulfurase/selenocysteine lyase